MKAKIFIVGLVCLFLISTNFSQETKAHFRETSWGMFQEEVQKIEKSEFVKKEHSKVSGLDILIYKGQAGQFEILIGYYFAENQLVEGRYVFTGIHSNKNIYIDDFQTVKNELTQKYSMPQKDETYWRNDLFKDDPSDWGMAISVDHLLYEAIWKLPDTEIRLQLSGDNYKIPHRLNYSSEIEKHKELIKKAKEKAKKTIWYRGDTQSRQMLLTRHLNQREADPSLTLYDKKARSSP